MAHDFYNQLSKYIDAQLQLFLSGILANAQTLAKRSGTVCVFVGRKEETLNSYSPIAGFLLRLRQPPGSPQLKALT